MQGALIEGLPTRAIPVAPSRASAESSGIVATACSRRPSTITSRNALGARVEGGGPGGGAESGRSRANHVRSASTPSPATPAAARTTAPSARPREGDGAGGRRAPGTAAADRTVVGPEPAG